MPYRTTPPGITRRDMAEIQEARAAIAEREKKKYLFAVGQNDEEVDKEFWRLHAVAEQARKQAQGFRDTILLGNQIGSRTA